MMRKSLGLALLSLLGLALSNQAVSAGEWTPDAGTMKAALHTATAEEGGFVERVVELTRTGVLPMSLVESTFQWARKRPAYKFQYFKHGLILRAHRLGIDLSAEAEVAAQGSGTTSPGSWFRNALRAVPSAF